MTKLNYRQKARLPKKSFAIRTKKGYGGKGKYLIPNISHDRNALAGISDSGTLAKKLAVKSKVYSKFPLLRK